MTAIAAIRSVFHERYAEQMRMPWKIWCWHWAQTIDHARREERRREERDERQAFEKMRRESAGRRSEEIG